MSSVAPEYLISYSRSDAQFALRLARDLRETGARIWIDQLDISPGSPWDEAIEEALKRCSGIVTVLSPASAGSRNVLDEVSYALQQGKAVIPVLLRRCDVPLRLHRIQHVDFTGDYSAALEQLRSRIRPFEPGISQPDDTTPVEGPRSGNRIRRVLCVVGGALAGLLLGLLAKAIEESFRPNMGYAVLLGFEPVSALPPLLMFAGAASGLSLRVARAAAICFVCALVISVIVWAGIPPSDAHFNERQMKLFYGSLFIEGGTWLGVVFGLIQVWRSRLRPPQPR